MLTMKRILLLFAILLSFHLGWTSPNPVDFLVFPNPNQGKFEITLTGNNQAVEVSIFNVLGTKVFCGTIQEEKIRCDLSQLEPGLYLVKIELQNHEVLMKRFYIK